MISITYSLPVKLYDGYVELIVNEWEETIRRPQFQPNTPMFNTLLDRFLENIIQYRTSYITNNINVVSEEDRRDHFLTEDYGLIKIQQERIEFHYNDQNQDNLNGIMRFYLLIEPLENPINNLTQEIVEQLIWDSFRLTYDAMTSHIYFYRPHPEQGDAQYEGTTVEIMDTPQNIEFSSEDSCPVLK